MIVLSLLLFSFVAAQSVELGGCSTMVGSNLMLGQTVECTYVITGLKNLSASDINVSIAADFDLPYVKELSQFENRSERKLDIIFYYNNCSGFKKHIDVDVSLSVGDFTTKNSLFFGQDLECLVNKYTDEQIVGYTFLGAFMGLMLGFFLSLMIWYFSPKEICCKSNGTVPVGWFFELLIYVCCGMCLGLVLGIIIPLCVMLI